RDTSRRLAPSIRGTPWASRATVTAAERPASLRRPSSWGRLARSARLIQVAPPPPATRRTSTTPRASRRPQPASATLPLPGHRLRRAPRRLRVAEVVVAEGTQRLVELVDERDAGGNVQPHDVLLGDPVEVLHERAQAVAVGGDEHALARAEVGHHPLPPAGADTPPPALNPPAQLP